MHRRPSRRLGALTLVVVLGVGALAACSNSDSDSGTKTDTTNSPSDKERVYTEDDTDITVADGHTFVIELPVTSGTGYAWTAESTPKLQQMLSEQVSSGSQPGSQATQRITFRAQGSGATTLVLNYARSFEPNEPPAKTATFDVTITG